MHRLFLSLCVAPLVFVTGCNTQAPTPDPVATQSWTMAQLHNFAGQQKPINDQVRHLEKSLKDGTASLNVKEIKTRSVEADTVEINHGGKFELRSGARFVMDGKEADVSKPVPAPKPGLSDEEFERKVAQRVQEELAKLKGKAGEELDPVKSLDRVAEIIEKEFDRGDKVKEAVSKLLERLDKRVRPQPVMPRATSTGSPEAKAATGKAWPLGDNTSDALIPIAERRLWKTESDRDMVLTATTGKVYQFHEAPARIQWPSLPNPWSPMVHL